MALPEVKEKINYGYGKPIGVKQANSLTGNGGRDKATFTRLFERLSKWEVELFYTDNGRQRHWHAWFLRKFIVVSKTLELVDLTMALFARFHVMKTEKAYYHYLIGTLQV